MSNATSMSEDPWELIRAARYLPNGSAKIAALERAISAADGDGDLAAGYATRTKHISACELGGAADRAIASFAWCLGRSDENPREFTPLLWEYKWIAAALPEFAAVSSVQIEATISDMEGRFSSAAVSRIPAAKIRWRVALAMGDLDSAADALDRWRQIQLTATGWQRMSDCVACDVAESSAALGTLDRHDEALEVAAPILDGGMRCAEVPHCTFAEVLLPMELTGRRDTAELTTTRGYGMVKYNPSFIVAVAQHADFRRAMGRPTAALDIIFRHWTWLSRVRSDTRRATYLSAAARVLRAHLDQPNVPDHGRLQITPNLGVLNEEGWVSLSALADAAHTEALRSAQALDARNGNSYWTRFVTSDPYSSN